MRRLASLLLALIAGPAAAQAPAPITLTALPAPDAAGRGLLKGASEAAYLMRRPVPTGGVYTSVLGPEGDRPRVYFWPGCPGFLANYKMPVPAAANWAGGGVRLVRDPAASPVEAIGLRDLEGPFTWPGAAPRQWSGLKSLSYTLDCSLARWDVPGGNNATDVFGVYADQAPAPIGVVTSSDGIGLWVRGSDGALRRIWGKVPGGTPPPGTRATLGIAIDAVNGVATITWQGQAIGAGRFTPPLAEGTDGRFGIGAQSPAANADPDMTLHAFSQTADGVTTRLAIPQGPDWFFPPACVLASRTDDAAAAGYPPTDFKRLRIEGGPTVGILFGRMMARSTISDCAIQGTVAIEAGGGQSGAVYRIDVDRCNLGPTSVAAIKAQAAILTCRSLQVLYPGRSVTVQRAGALRIDGLGVSPGGVGVTAAFLGLRSAGDRTLFGLADATLDWEWGGPDSYFDFDASGRTTPGSATVTLDRVACGTGTRLATLRARPTQPAGHGVLVLRDCTSDGQPAVPASPGWTIAGTINGQPAQAPPPGPPAPPVPAP